MVTLNSVVPNLVLGLYEAIDSVCCLSLLCNPTPIDKTNQHI